MEDPGDRMIAAEVRFRDRAQFPDGVAPAARVAVTRQVGEIDGPLSRTARTPVDSHLVQVGEPRLAGGRARARDVALHERINQRRLADVGPSDHRYVRYVVVRDAVRGRGTRHEP